MGVRRWDGLSQNCPSGVPRARRDPWHGCSAPESLVAFRSEQSYPDVEDFRAEVAGLEALGAYAAWPADVLEGDEAIQIPAALVSGELLRALSVPAAAGRLLTLSDDRKGADPVVVVTDDFARRHGGVALMGQSLSLSGKPFRVVGILPPRFQLPRSEAQILVPDAGRVTPRRRRRAARTSWPPSPGYAGAPASQAHRPRWTLPGAGSRSSTPRPTGAGPSRWSRCAAG